MRLLFALSLLLAACSQQPAEPRQSNDMEVWTAGTRDRLCIKGDRAGFIVYGKGDANCSARGRVSRDGDAIRITPDGETKCHFDGHEWVGDGPRRMMAFGVAGKGDEACNYYCGPGASLKQVQFGIANGKSDATDLAGDPLC